MVSITATVSADEITLAMIATGVIRLYERVSAGKRIAYPYPDVLQKGLNRLTAACLKRGQRPPQGVVELLVWCQHPISEWGLDLPTESLGEDDTLLHNQMPTSFCDSWACSTPDIEADLTETRFMQSVFEICKSLAGESAYTVFRKLLIDKRVLTALEFQETLADPMLFHLASQIRAAYQPVPSGADFNGEYLCCRRCGNLLQASAKGEPLCENERCQAAGIGIGRRIPEREQAYWLIRGLRRYIADPGIAEVRLAQALEQLGLTVDLWPAFDRYDLRVTFASGESWAVDVKDWANPFLLARQVHQFLPEPEWSRAYFVFPDERIDRRSDYVRAFRNNCPHLNNRVHAAAEYQFINDVKKHLRKQNA